MSVAQIAGYKEWGFTSTGSNYCQFALLTPGRTDLLLDQLCEHLQRFLKDLMEIWDPQRVLGLQMR